MPVHCTGMNVSPLSKCLIRWTMLYHERQINLAWRSNMHLSRVVISWHYLHVAYLTRSGRKEKSIRITYAPMLWLASDDFTMAWPLLPIMEMCCPTIRCGRHPISTLPLPLLGWLGANYSPCHGFSHALPSLRSQVQFLTTSILSRGG